jgi:anti-sigma28 factor (negative regulator of flagellin synthesis)
MRISDEEIRRSLEALSQQPPSRASLPAIDESTSDLVLGELEKTPDVRMEKVLPLRLAILQNRYNVPDERVAEKILGRCLADRLL